MGERVGQCIYSDGVRSVTLTADEVIVGEVERHGGDEPAVYHVISFSRAAWHEIMLGSEREFRQEAER